MYLSVSLRWWYHFNQCICFVMIDCGTVLSNYGMMMILFYASLARLWAFGGCLKCSISLRLLGIYLTGRRPFYLWYIQLYKDVFTSFVYAISFFLSNSVPPMKKPGRGRPTLQKPSKGFVHALSHVIALGLIPLLQLVELVSLAVP